MRKYLTRGNEKEFLFNLVTDKPEENSVLNQYPEGAIKLKKLLVDWESEVGDLNFTKTN